MECAIYAMVQHYLWLVVFGWMVIEGIQMYMSLVKVFDNLISRYMLKYNIAAWGMLIYGSFASDFIGYHFRLAFIEHLH